MKSGPLDPSQPFVPKRDSRIQYDCDRETGNGAVHGVSRPLYPCVHGGVGSLLSSLP